MGSYCGFTTVYINTTETEIYFMCLNNWNRSGSICTSCVVTLNLCILLSVCVCISYGSHRNQRLLPSRALTDLYLWWWCNVQNYCFSYIELCPSSGVLETRKHNGAEEDAYSVGSLRKSQPVQWLRLALSKGPNCQSSFHQFLHNHHHLSFGAGTIGQ
jgi:hypothetical protein